jgi:N-acetylneuraminic acid mutarotase
MVSVTRDAVYVIGGIDTHNLGDTLDGAQRAVINADGTLSRFSPLAAKLHSGRETAASVRVGNVIYVIGGRSSATGRPDVYLDTIEATTINADGTLAPFSVAANTLRTPRFGAAAVIVGNLLYVIGGSDGSVRRDDVEVATINPDGTLSAFRTVPDVTLATAVDQHTASIVGDNLYVVGGFSTTGTCNIQRAKILGDGTLSTFANVPTATLQVLRGAHGAVVVGDSLYVMGGASAVDYLDTVERATIDAHGELSNFSIVSKLTRRRRGLTSVVIGNYVYALGGYDFSISQSSERAPIGASAALSPLAAAPTTQAAVARSQAVTAVVGNNVYLVGGDDGSVVGPPVARAAVLGDGTLAPFASTNVPSLRQMRRGAAGFVAGPYLYVVGGLSPAGAALQSCERALIRDDGTLADFEAVAGVALVRARAQHTTVVVGDSVFVLGGFDPTSNQPIASVERATIDATGALSPFTSVANVSLSLPRRGHTSVVSGRRIWNVGGLTSVAAGDAERADVGADGTLGPFQLVPGVGLTAGRDGQSAAVVGSTLVLAGGSGWPSGRDLGDLLGSVIAPTGELQPFAPISGVALQPPRHGHASLVLGNSFYILGGESVGGFLGTVERATLK